MKIFNINLNEEFKEFIKENIDRYIEIVEE